MTARPLPRWRTNLLRAAYVPLAFGLALFQLPLLASLGPATDMMDGVVTCLLSALCLLSFVGLFRPVAMLPLLLFEVFWKALWLGLVGIPAWLAGSMSESMAANLFACGLVVAIVPLVPWDWLPAFLGGAGPAKPASGAPAA